jgi:UDP-glucose 4-epimerase
MGRVDKKIVVITGGRSYWGSVAIADLLEEEGRAVVKEINSSGGAVKF